MHVSSVVNPFAQGSSELYQKRKPSRPVWSGILLGCAGMAGLQESVSLAAGVPVVDAVWAGVVEVGALARAGAQTSKRNLYRPVDPRPGLDVLPPGISAVYRRSP